MNLYEQLKAEYEASTDCEWELFPRQGYSPREEEAFLGYEIDGPPQPVRGQFVRRADAIFCISAHEKGYPLFMAAFEAAVALLIADDAVTKAYCADFAEGKEQAKARFDSDYEYEEAFASLRIALSPLLAEEE